MKFFLLFGLVWGLFALWVYRHNKKEEVIKWK